MHVLVIDDHPLYREGVKALLYGLDPELRFSGASNVNAALQLTPRDDVDLVLLDMNLPGISHMAALEATRAHWEAASVVVVSGDDSPSLVLSAIDAGAAGFIPKSTDPQATIDALRLVLAQGLYLPPMTLRHAALQQRSGRRLAAPPLSDKQRAVLKRLLQGHSNKLIARELGVAEGTVKAHLWAIYQLMGVNSRSQAMCRAFELGYIGRD